MIEFIKQNTPNINGETSIECVDRAIRAMPAADVVEVVRCRDCKHLTDDGFCWQNIHAVVGYKMPNPNDYCSYGKIKDGEQNGL